MTSKDLAKLKLKKLIEKYETNHSDIFSKMNRFNEANTRIEYIDPLLHLFGWDIQNERNTTFEMQDVVVEAFITKHDKPDYLLRRNGATILTVEAEKASKDLDKDTQPTFQTLSYGWQAGNDIAILTNFEQIKIFQTTSKPDKANLRKAYKEYRYIEYLDHFDEIWTLMSKDAAYDGSMEEAIKQISPKNATKTRLDSYFLEELNEWRVLIGNDLLINKPEYTLDTKKLNDDTQTFLNQVIFLRFAEDNNFEEENSLSLVFENSEDFEKHLRELDQKYNSGIFENHNIAKLLNPYTINKIVNALYYPKGVYNFAVIDLAILGRIYEEFLQSELSINGQSVELVKTAQASIKSVISTPVELTNVIVQKALSDKLENCNTVEDILKLKIADIAVGSGVFLIAAYDQIEGRIIDLLANKQGKKAEKNLIPLSLKKRILSDILYGVDIDHHAVQVTKFSLALKLLNNEDKSRFFGHTPIIPSLNETIQNFNSLISTNDISTYLSTNDYDSRKINDEIDVINPGEFSPTAKFDVIVGNPPYLKTSDLRKGSNIEFSIYIEKYQSTYKQFDKYFMFVEKAISLLALNGVAALLVPNKFFVIDSAYKLRNLMLQKGNISEIIDFGATQLFKDKSTYVAVIKLQKSNQIASLKYSEVSSVLDINETQTKSFKYENLGNKDEPWLLTSNNFIRNLYDTMLDLKMPKLSEALNISNGIQTSRNDVYIINLKNISDETDNYIKIRNKEKNQIFSLEKSLLRPFYKNAGKTLSAFTKLEKDSWLIFPYRDGKLIKENVLRNRYPGVYQYLSYYKTKLLPKNFGGVRDVSPEPQQDQWYAFGRSQALHDWKNDKLVMGVLSNKPNVAYDGNKLMLASGGTAGYVPVYKSDKLIFKKYDLEYIQSWINYPPTDKMFKMLSTYFEGGFWTHGTNIMKYVPFLTIDFDNVKQKSLYDKIVNEVRELNNEHGSIKKRKILTETIYLLIDELVSIRLGVTNER
ncbi:Eco57I restriction-modification methylase domain-containing protein [Leuconostoc mesenteroides]|uniref:Eco57I restriction-modification methylase domain-containing protein n=1 Tax=Leuconostoc mesenteroides TaxID=1245 RepID=UPI00235F048B|nr:N-6 DNA methylase [Leuconostoc mesenteroides]